MAALASLAFVAAPAVSPTITLNLDQPGLVKVLADSFSLGGLDFDGDPETGTGSYATRQVEFTLQFTGTYEEAASAIQAAVRQLTQPAAGFDRRNWLMFRWVGSQPFFLEVFPTSVGALDWRQSGAGLWEMPVSVLCAFGVWGAPDDIASFTIANDPSSGTNRMMYALPTIKGDLETPLLLAQTTGPGVSMSPSAAGAGGGVGVLSTYGLTGGFTHTFLARNLTELTSGTDTGATVTAAGSNYIEGDYKQTTFATTTSMATRLSGAFSTTLTPMPGQYRAIVRATTSTGGPSNVAVRLGVLADGVSAYKYGPTTAFFLQANASHFLDLGIFQFPPGARTGAAGLAAAASATRAVSLSIQASTDVTINLRWDELFLIPFATNYGDGETAFVNFPSWNASVQHNVVAYDGIEPDMRTLYDASGTAPFSGIPVPAFGMSWVGGLPMVRPGRNNYLQFLYPDSTVAGTTTFAGRYYPRYAHVKPSTT